MAREDSLSASAIRPSTKSGIEALISCAASIIRAE